ncbi:uncharacterized protein J3D65DRAFT_395397 [Phyllosticta citribraziliensis]|uniref:Uncharacterized protein n=1 Tax=Phyllosticta citribraziliensis TaxID=989973 RepID=A0ABR1LL64_9PEZI
METKVSKQASKQTVAHDGLNLWLSCLLLWSQQILESFAEGCRAGCYIKFCIMDADSHLCGIRSSVMRRNHSQVDASWWNFGILQEAASTKMQAKESAVELSGHLENPLHAVQVSLAHEDGLDGNEGRHDVSVCLRYCTGSAGKSASSGRAFLQQAGRMHARSDALVCIQHQHHRKKK